MADNFIKVCVGFQWVSTTENRHCDDDDYVMMTMTSILQVY